MSVKDLNFVFLLKVAEMITLPGLSIQNTTCLRQFFFQSKIARGALHQEMQ